MLFSLLTAIIISTIDGQLKKIDAISNTIEAVPKKDVIASIKNSNYLNESQNSSAVNSFVITILINFRKHVVCSKTFETCNILK